MINYASPLIEGEDALAPLKLDEGESILQVEVAYMGTGRHRVPFHNVLYLTNRRLSFNDDRGISYRVTVNLPLNDIGRVDRGSILDRSLLSWPLRVTMKNGNRYVFFFHRRKGQTVSPADAYIELIESFVAS